jgi:hypothetical protein
MGAVSYYNVWLRGLCVGVSWFRLLCFPAGKHNRLNHDTIVSLDIAYNATLLSVTVKWGKKLVEGKNTLFFSTVHYNEC